MSCPTPAACAPIQKTGSNPGNSSSRMNMFTGVAENRLHLVQINQALLWRLIFPVLFCRNGIKVTEDEANDMRAVLCNPPLGWARTHTHTRIFWFTAVKCCCLSRNMRTQIFLVLITNNLKVYQKWLFFAGYELPGWVFWPNSKGFTIQLDLPLVWMLCWLSLHRSVRQFM